jgi:hypothetical protein
MRHLRLATVLALSAAFATAPVAAEVYTITLTNGTTFESRYQPRQATWDASMMEFLTETGNWAALPRTLVSEVVPQSETKGFGRVMDTTTVDLGFAPNDLPEATTAGQVANPAGADAFNRNYDVQQFAEPNSGGGLPVWGMGGSFSSAPSAIPAAPPAPAPAPPPAPAPAPGGGSGT